MVVAQRLRRSSRVSWKIGAARLKLTAEYSSAARLPAREAGLRGPAPSTRVRSASARCSTDPAHRVVPGSAPPCRASSTSRRPPGARPAIGAASERRLEQLARAGAVPAVTRASPGPSSARRSPMAAPWTRRRISSASSSSFCRRLPGGWNLLEVGQVAQRHWRRPRHPPYSPASHLRAPRGGSRTHRRSPRARCTADRRDPGCRPPGVRSERRRSAHVEGGGGAARGRVVEPEALVDPAHHVLHRRLYLGLVGEDLIRLAPFLEQLARGHAVAAGLAGIRDLNVSIRNSLTLPAVAASRRALSRSIWAIRAATGSSPAWRRGTRPPARWRRRRRHGAGRSGRRGMRRSAGAPSPAAGRGAARRPRSRPRPMRSARRALVQGLEHDVVQVAAQPPAQASGLAARASAASPFAATTVLGRYRHLARTPRARSRSATCLPDGGRGGRSAARRAGGRAGRRRRRWSRAGPAPAPDRRTGVITRTEVAWWAPRRRRRIEELGDSGSRGASRSSASTRTLPGLRSRWTTSRRCACSTARATSRKARAAADGRAPPSHQRSMGSPSMYSITKYGRPSGETPPSSSRCDVPVLERGQICRSCRKRWRTSPVSIRA